MWLDTLLATVPGARVLPTWGRCLDLSPFGHYSYTKYNPLDHFLRLLSLFEQFSAFLSNSQPFWATLSLFEWLSAFLNGCQPFWAILSLFEQFSAFLSNSQLVLLLFSLSDCFLVFWTTSQSVFLIHCLWYLVKPKYTYVLMKIDCSP